MLEDVNLRKAIQDCLKTYQLISKSKKYSNLALCNEASIFSSVILNNREACHDLLSKKNYYTHKFYKLLNDSISPEQSKVTQGSSYDGMEPELIANRYHARQYVTHCVMSDSHRRQRIQTVIDKHMALQKEHVDKKEEVARTFETRQKERQPTVALAKLSSVNSHIENARSTENEEALAIELNKIDEELYEKSKDYSAETIKLLSHLRIPFFCLNDKLKYPELQNDMEYILDLLLDFLSKR